MNPLVDVQILKIFLSESARHGGMPLYEVVVDEARGRGMAGASVIRGVMGFGAGNLLRTAKILRLSEDLPVIVEIVDTPERVADFLPIANGLVEEGAIVLEQAKAVFHLPMRVRDVMSVDVATVEKDTPLSTVVDLLLRRGVKALPVLEGERIVGVVTGGDLLLRGNMQLRLDIQNQLPHKMRKEQLRLLDARGLKAGDIMTSPAQVLNIGAGVAEALNTMARRNLKRLPVTDASGRLMGIVSRADVLRAIGRAASTPLQLAALPEGARETVRDVMFTDAPTVDPSTPLTEVLKKLLETPLRRVVVVNAENQVLGIILDRDLVDFIARQSKPAFWRVLIGALAGKRHVEPGDLQGVAEDVMNRDVAALSPEISLGDAVRLLVEKRVKRMAVIDADNRLLGMLDRDTALRALAE